MQVYVYAGVNDEQWENRPWFNMETKSWEIGICIQFLQQSRADSNAFVAFITKHKLNSFPGVTLSNCPDVLKPLAFPYVDKNGVSCLICAGSLVPF